MKQLLFYAFIFLFFQGISQTSYFIKDQTNNESIPFSKIVTNTGQPIISDLDGVFQLTDTTIQTLLITSFGYKDTLVSFDKISNHQILLMPLSREIQEVVILPGENPAHRIMDLVIANRKKNNPTENDAFRYESYSKFIFDLNPEAIASIPDTTTDSMLINIRNFFIDKHLFILENASRRTFIPPSRDKEEIIAYKVSGFSNPIFSTFANEMQSFSFYENQFQLLGKTYINPIAFGGTRRYLFILEDTTIIGKDTTFTISFRPRKGKNFDGLKGRLYINTNGYAVEKVITEPDIVDTSMVVQIVQEYSLIGGEKWFPSKLSTEMSFITAVFTNKLKNGYMQCKGNTYIKNVEFNPKGVKKYTFDNASISTAENANEIDEKTWKDSLRVYEITDKEKNTYTTIDSISKAEHLEKSVTFIQNFIEGKIPIGYFNIDAVRLINYNGYEGTRLGFGLENSKKMMKKIIIGGYFGYGLKDRTWKYGGYSEIQLYRPKSIKLHLAYQHDVAERGGTAFQKEVFNLKSPDLYRRIFIRNMDKQRLAEVVLSGFITSNFKLSLIGNYQRIYYSDGYLFTPFDPTTYFSVYSFDAAETAFEIKWNIREKVMQLGDIRVPKGTQYPKIALKVTKGWKGVAESDYNYLRLKLEISQDISIRGAGKLSWLLSGSQTIGDVPLFLQQVAVGTGKNWNLSVRNTFETISPSEFYASQQAALFTRFTFFAFKTKKKWFNPQISLYHAIGYGTMKNTSNHSVTFKTMEKGFYEGGIIIDRIYGTLGMGVFYRYGAYSDVNWQNNLMFKISLNF